jgi:hypothetical protein
MDSDSFLHIIVKKNSRIGMPKDDTRRGVRREVHSYVPSYFVLIVISQHKVTEKATKTHPMREECSLDLNATILLTTCLSTHKSPFITRPTLWAKGGYHAETETPKLQNLTEPAFT